MSFGQSYSTTAPAQRTCNIPYYQHPPSYADYNYSAAQTLYQTGNLLTSSPIYYDDYGECNPYPQTSYYSASVSTTGFDWTSILFYGALAFGGYYLWTHRKKLF